MIGEYFEKLEETCRLKHELATVTFNLKLTEARLLLQWIREGKIDGKNETIREAQLRVLLAENFEYRGLLEQKDNLIFRISTNEAWTSAYTAALAVYNGLRKQDGI